MIISFLFIVSGEANTANLVSGQYISAGGTAVVLRLTIQNPSPSNLIVEQYLSPGNEIAGTSPHAKKINSASGKVKWLFRNTQSGNINLTIRLKAPLVGSVHATVHYRDPQGGMFTELQISP